VTGSVLFQPIAEIDLDGAQVDATIRRCIASVVVIQALDAPALAEICLVAPPAHVRHEFAAGRKLRIGVKPQGLALFSGTIAGVEQDFSANGRNELRVRAHDPLDGLRKRRRFRAIAEGSSASLWQEAAGELGLAFAAPSPTTGRRLVQFGSSDLAFLLTTAADEGLHAAFDGETLSLVSLAGLDDTVDLAWGRTLVAANVEEAGEHVARSSRAHGWDPAAAASFSATAGLARQDKAIELRGFGLDSLGSDEGILVLPNRNATNEDAVRDRAQAAMDIAAAKQFVVSGTALGEPRLRPGVRVNLTGLGDNGTLTAVVTRATHVVNGTTGYLTEFSSAPPERQKPDEAPVVTLGVVTDIDDPEAAGRCRVELPAFDGLDAGLLPVVIAGAGAAKGAACLPDVGDKVVVLFPGGDIAHGLVLGGLYGTANLPRGTTTQSPRAMVIASGGGQSLRLGGRQKSLSLSTARGDMLSLGGGPSRLAVGGDLEISAVGGTITIRGSQIRFVRGEQ
jgi:uncharacterized protein involved in type VI secretion and phage assembly